MSRCPAHGNRIQCTPSGAVNLFGTTPQPDSRRTFVSPRRPDCPDLSGADAPGLPSAGRGPAGCEVRQEAGAQVTVASSGRWATRARVRSRAKAICTNIGCSLQRVPSLSNTAISWAGGTTSGFPSWLTASTKESRRALAGHSRQERSGWVTSAAGAASTGGTLAFWAGALSMGAR